MTEDAESRQEEGRPRSQLSTDISAGPIDTFLFLHGMCLHILLDSALRVFFSIYGFGILGPRSEQTNLPILCSGLLLILFLPSWLVFQFWLQRHLHPDAQIRVWWKHYLIMALGGIPVVLLTTPLGIALPIIGALGALRYVLKEIRVGYRRVFKSSSEGTEGK